MKKKVFNEEKEFFLGGDKQNPPKIIIKPKYQLTRHDKELGYYQPSLFQKGA